MDCEMQTLPASTFLVESDPNPDDAANEPFTSRRILPLDRLGVISPALDERRYFEIIPTNPDGNCLFRALSQSLYGHQNTHQQCRIEIVEYILDEANWPNYMIHIRAQSSDFIRTGKGRTEKSQVEQEADDGDPDDTTLKESYKRYMLKDGVYGTFLELNAASELFHFDMIVVRQLGPLDASTNRSTTPPKYFYNILSFKDTFTQDTTHHFLFSGHGPNAGHFEFLQPTTPNPGILPINPFRIYPGYYQVLDVTNFCILLTRFAGRAPGSESNDAGGGN